MVLVPLYDSLTEDVLTFVIKQGIFYLYLIYEQLNFYLQLNILCMHTLVLSTGKYFNIAPLFNGRCQHMLGVN